MKKIFVLFMTLMLVFATAFTTSSMAISLTPIPSPLPLDSETEQQIIEDKGWSNIPYEDITIKYFGTMSDGSMLIRTSKKGAASNAELLYDVIGDYLYVASSSSSSTLIKVYKNNKFYNIKEAYETDVINDSVLDEIAQILKFERIGCTTELDSEIEYRIKKAYIRYYNLDKDKEIPLSDIKVNYYGTTNNGNILVKCDSKYLGYFAVLTEEVIGNYVYKYSGNHVVLFNGYSISEIKDKYEERNISDSELDEIAQILNFSIYEPVETIPSKELDDKTVNLIKEYYITSNELTNASYDEIVVKYYGTLSDGNLLVKCDYKYDVYETNLIARDIGKYSQSYVGKPVGLYKNGHFYDIRDSYENGYISDTVLDEIAEALKFEGYIPTEASTSVGSTETQPTTLSKTESENNSNTTNTSNGAIATGDNNTIIATSIITLLAFGATIILIKRQKLH